MNIMSYRIHGFRVIFQVHQPVILIAYKTVMYCGQSERGILRQVTAFNLKENKYHYTIPKLDGPDLLDGRCSDG